MSSNTIKMIAIAGVFGFAIAFAAYRPANVGAAAAVDPATAYKELKCSMCHTPTAAKFFDPTKDDKVLSDTILNGKKGEKPPNMPAFDETKLSAADRAAMVTYMKSLRTAAGN